MNTRPQGAFFFNDFANSYIPHILKEVYIDRVYAPYLDGKKDLVIVDCGSNIGLTNFYFKDFAKRVIAVEPSKQHSDCIRAMIEYNDIKNIEIMQVALGKEDTKQQLFHNTNSTMFSLKQEVSDGTPSEEVEILTMKSLLERAKVDKVDLLKFDVEGYESEIINSEGFASVVEKIPLIIGEHHSWSSMNKQQFQMCLQDLGYTFNWMNKTEASVFVAQRP